MVRVAGVLMAGDGEVIVSRQLAFSLVSLVAILLASPAVAQGNIDAGKTPAQIFADTCGNCHRSPSQVRRASASFLRSHYTTGSDEAAAMARYLANVPNEPRASQQKKEAARPKETPAETPRRAEPKEQARGPAASSKSSRRGAAEAKSAAASTSGLVIDSKPAQPQPEVAPPPTAVKPALEPFEE